MPSTAVPPPLRPAQRALLAVLWLHLVAIAILAVSPRLHHWIHPDADDDDHDCAVVLFLHGGCHDAPAAVVHAPVSPGECQPVVFVRMTPPWVASVFLLGRILEHAPPRAA